MLRIQDVTEGMAVPGEQCVYVIYHVLSRLDGNGKCTECGGWKMRRRIHFPPISQISSFHRGPPTRNERYQVQLTFCGPVLEEGTHLLYRNKIKVETSHVGAIEEFVWDYGCVK